MEIFKHPACTHSLGAPADMQDGSCETLPVFEHDAGYGVFTYSFWKPNEEDIKVLLDGGSIILGVRASGRQHPVVSVGVTGDPV